jgi:hypothetical protein
MTTWMQRFGDEEAIWLAQGRNPNRVSRHVDAAAG